MKGNMFSIRLSADLTAEISRQAAKRGITRTAWAAHLIERGLMAETCERLLEAVEESLDRSIVPVATIPSTQPPTASASPAALPGWDQMVFMGCFTSAMLKQLNNALNRSSTEIGKIAVAAREQAAAESQAIIKRSSS